MGAIRRNRLAVVSADCDRRVDVLYVGRGERVPAEGEGLPGGIELDYALADGSPCGATIIRFRRNGWPERPGQLTRVIAAHLSVGKNRVAEAIRTAVVAK